MTQVHIDKTTCSNCSLCAQICPNLIFEVKEKVTQVAEEHTKGCIHCGQCIAVCHTDSIAVEGVDNADFFPLPEERLSPEQLRAFLGQRRSVRAYQQRDVPKELAVRALEMGALAPMSFPPWLVEVTTVLGREKIAGLAEVVAGAIEKMVDMNHHFISRYFMKRAVGKERYQFLDEFFIPLLEEGLEVFHQQHIDVILRDAPALMVFHTPPIAFEGPIDCALAAAHTALALQSLGLGVCFNGLITGASQMEKEKIHQAFGVPEDHSIHAAFTFGFPRVRYHKGLQRRFAATHFLS